MPDSQSDLGELFGASDEPYSSTRMFSLINDPEVYEVLVNRFDRVFYSDPAGKHSLDEVFPNSKEYVSWLSRLLSYTDARPSALLDPSGGPFEATFRQDKTSVRGSIHVVPGHMTGGDPSVTIRLDAYSPDRDMTLDTLMDQGSMDEPIRDILEQAVRGRSNILVSGGSGSGKTTLARALAWYIEPSHRIVTVEEVEELHLDRKLPNVVTMTTFRARDESGAIVREYTQADLVREAFRMRPDRIWVGEVRGREAYALMKACNSGHDGSCATIHADNASQAIQQLVTYVMEEGLPEAVARDQVSKALSIVVQTARVSGRRVVMSVTEVEPVREGSSQRENILFEFDIDSGQHQRRGHPSPSLLRRWARYGVSYDHGPFRI